MLENRVYMENIAELNFSRYKFTLYYAEILDQGFAEFPHNHSMYEIYYAMDGNIRLKVADSEIVLTEGEACFLAKDVHHHVLYDPDEGKRYFAIIFDMEVREMENMCGPDGLMEYRDILEAIGNFEKCGCCVSHVSKMKELSEDIMDEIKEKKLGWNTQAVMKCYQFCIEALRQIDSRKVMDRRFSGKENLAMSVSKYIHRHYTEDISVKSAAEELNVSPRHLNRAYKEMFNVTFMKNANLLRIAYAKNYLSTTGESIEMISEKVGFASTHAFYKLFQQYEGLSPAQYREMRWKKGIGKSAEGKKG